MAENRAAFSLRRRRSLGFSKCRWLRTIFSVPSRSIFFFNRRRAFSTGSPFFSLISVKTFSLPLCRLGADGHHGQPDLASQELKRLFSRIKLSTDKIGRHKIEWGKKPGLLGCIPKCLYLSNIHSSLTLPADLPPGSHLEEQPSRKCLNRLSAESPEALTPPLPHPSLLA